ncbi:MAG: MG2 domain-containing protein [Phycisphaerales bacterium]
MNPDTNNEKLNETADALVFGLLNENEAARVQARAASDPAMAAAIQSARARREALLALPTAEPSSALIAAALNSAQADAQRVARRHGRRRSISRGIGGVLAFAVAVIACFHAWIDGWKPPVVGVQLVAQQEVNAGSRGSMRVVVQDVSGEEPATGKNVSLVLRGGSGGAVTLASFKTDANGTASPSFEYPDWAAGNYTLSVEVEGQTHLERTVELKRERRVMLSTDKPQYQPGQTIHVRALALTRGDGKPAAKESAVFSVVDPSGNTIFKKSGATSEFGIVSADCELASEIREGPYTIRADIGTTQSSRTVEVKKYVLPKFKVGLELDAQFYTPGATVKGTIDARYFFGKAVSGKVEVVVRPIGIVTDEIKAPAVNLDADGRGAFSVELPKKLFGREQDGGDARVEIVATVRDTAGQEVKRVASRVVSAAALRMEVVPECETLVVGVPQKIHVFVTAPDGSPASARVGVGDGEGIATSDQGLATIEWTPTQDNEKLDVWAKAGKSRVHRVVSLSSVREGFVLRTDGASYEAGGTMVVTALGAGVQPVFVDLIKDGQTVATYVVEMKEGRGELAVDLPAELSGAVMVEAYRFNAMGLPVRTSRPVLVRPATRLNVAVGADKPEHRPGEGASLTFTLTSADGKPAPGAVSLAVVDEAALSVMKDRPGMESAFFLLEDELLKPAAVLYREDMLSPRLTKEQSNRASFGAAMSRGSVRGVDPATRLEQLGFGRVSRNELWRYLENGGAGLAPADFGSPNVKALLASSHGEAEWRFEHERREAMSSVYGAWAITVVAAVLAGLVVLGLYVRSTAIMFAVVIALLALVTALMLPALGQARSSARGLRGQMPPDAAAGPFFGGMPTTDAQLPMPMMNASAGPSKSPLSPTRVREWFPETLVWAPELIADENGKATIGFDFADSITNWKALGSVVSPTGALGSFDADLRVFQPFFVDVNAPVALVQNDVIDLPLVVYNYLETPQRVKLNAEVGDWCVLLSEPDFEIDLKPGEVRSVGLRLRATKVGVHSLLVNAGADGVADAIRKTIEVVPDGVPVEQVVSASIDDALESEVVLPPGAIGGSERLLVRIFPSTFSEVLGGLDGILAIPHGCFEQTSSTTYPNVLALDYLRTTGKAAPEVEARARQYIHLGYQRLLSFEVAGGGFDWFGRAPANLVLTAYGLMEFEDMARVHDVDPALIERTRKWLLSKRAADGSWNADAHMLNDGLAGSVHRGGDLTLATTAYVAWSVFGNGQASEEAESTLNWLLSHEPTTVDNQHTLALMCNALLAMSPKDAGPYLARLVSLAERAENGKSARWSMPVEARTTFYGRGGSAEIETTSLAVLALMKAKQESPLCRSALTWITAQRDARGAWHSTQATVLALKALLSASGRALGGDGQKDIRISVDGREVRKVSIEADQSDVVQLVDLSKEFAAGARAVRVEDVTKSGCTAQITTRAFVPRPDDTVGEATLAVDVVYDKSELKVGDTLKAKATVRNRAAEAAPMVMVDLPVPAGFAPDLDAFDGLREKGVIARYEATPRSVIVYLTSIPAGGAVRLDYGMRSTMPVEVTTPGAAVWEYYNPANRGVGRSGRVKSL